jgi:tripartite-type tricarboxylate transporter receptor subunit TctC
MRSTRRRFLQFAAVAASAPALPRYASALDYPTRAIRFIVPYPAGGATDAAARVVGEFLSRSFGQQIVVENKSGGGSLIGVESAAASAPDGYMVLVTTDIVASAPHTFKMRIDPLKALMPVVQLSRQPVVLAVHPSLGINTLAEFVALAKQQPGMSFATSGIGTQQHITAEWFASLAGIKLAHVPYRGGAPALNDLIAGHVKIGSLGSTPLIAHHQAGTLKLLAQSTAERAPTLPDVPTFEELGFKGLVLEQWIGMFLPAGTPDAIAVRLNSEANRAIADAAVRQSFSKQALEPVGGGVEQFDRLFREDYAKYARLVKELKITAN